MRSSTQSKLFDKIYKLTRSTDFKLPKYKHLEASLTWPSVVCMHSTALRLLWNIMHFNIQHYLKIAANMCNFKKSSLWKKICFTHEKREKMELPDSKYKSRFPPSHFRLNTSFIKFKHSSSWWSCLEYLPGLNPISTSISNSKSSYQWRVLL